MPDSQGAPNDHLIANAPIDPGAEVINGSVPGVSGQKENEVFATAANRHELDILKQEMGILGKLFGTSTTAATNIGGFALLASFLFVGISFCFPNSPELNDARKWAYALASGSLGYLFGSATRKG
jgi:hypothetical protein